MPTSDPIVIPLSAAQLQHKIQQSPGLIPVDINIKQQQLYWFDFGRYHFYEGFFKNSIRTYTGLQQSKGVAVEYFVTSIAVLDNHLDLGSMIQPSGFIFHIGRCGSTLLAKALSRSRKTLVFGEAASHNAICHLLSYPKRQAPVATKRNIHRYRQLILSMARNRSGNYSNHIIKFTSLNLVFLDFILTTFPNIPTLLLYRDPVEIMVSFLRGKTDWIKSDDSKMHAFYTGLSVDAVSRLSVSERIQEYIGHLMNRALAAGQKKDICYLNYDQLTVDIMPEILTFFNLELTSAESAAAKSLFQQYSKHDFGKKVFLPDGQKKQQSAPAKLTAQIKGDLGPLYSALLARPQLLID